MSDARRLEILRIEQADEIERLRKELAEAKAELETTTTAMKMNMAYYEESQKQLAEAKALVVETSKQSKRYMEKGVRFEMQLAEASKALIDLYQHEDLAITVETETQIALAQQEIKQVYPDDNPTFCESL